MSRYIDIDDVANAIYHHFPSVRTMADARGIIEEAPHIDIVRCKECRYKDMEICPMYRLVVAGVRKYDDYCSYGEREGK